MGMAIIRELNKNNNVIKPNTCEGVLETRTHYVEDIRRLDEMVDYNLVELGIFGSYDSYVDSCGNNDSMSPYSFSRQIGLNTFLGRVLFP